MVILVVETGVGGPRPAAPIDGNEDHVAGSNAPGPRRPGKLAQAAAVEPAVRKTKKKPGASGRPPRGGKDAKGPGAGRRRRFFNYPRAGKGPIRRWVPSWRFVLGSFLLMIALLFGGFITAYTVIEIPNVSQFALATTSVVYYNDGTTEMGRFAEVNRNIIDTSVLPDYVGNAVVASEDRTFYSNKGIDPKGIVRALWNNLSGGSQQGASTLTQQYVKNYYVDTTGSYAGKFEQAIMAIKIDHSKTKKEILDSYLNTVYFGRGAYGIDAASQAFFGKGAASLTISESALLAGILPAPSAYDPAVSPQTAKDRWARVLQFMAEDGYITEQERSAAVFPTTVEDTQTETYGGSNGYLLQMVRAELRDSAKLTDDQIDAGGYQIVTTISKEDQDAAVAAVKALPSGYSSNLKVALVSMDATNGGILALYGGSDFLTNQVNSATSAIAQAGSTYKPFALVAALENGATLANTFDGSSPQTIDGTQFQNFQNVSYGMVNLVRATQDSINTAYLHLNDAVGPEKTNDVAVRAGYPQDTQGMNTYLQNVLGSASPHTLDIATAYTTFASQGTRYTPHIVSKATNKSGDVVYSGPTSGEKVFDDDVMADATYAMQQVVKNGSGKTAQELGRPVAAKTGSSSDNKSAQFAGFTPQIATAVTLYQSGPNGEEESITPWGDYDEITGSTYPADIFTAYMKTALNGLEVKDFPDRSSGSSQPGKLGGGSALAPQQESTATAQPQEPVEPGNQSTGAPEPGNGRLQNPEPGGTGRQNPGGDNGDDNGGGNGQNPGGDNGGGNGQNPGGDNGGGNGQNPGGGDNGGGGGQNPGGGGNGGGGGQNPGGGGNGGAENPNPPGGGDGGNHGGGGVNN